MQPNHPLQHLVGKQISFTLNALDAWAVFVSLELACKHTALHSDVRRRTEQVTQLLQERLATNDTPNLPNLDWLDSPATLTPAEWEALPPAHQYVNSEGDHFIVIATDDGEVLIPVRVSQSWHVIYATPSGVASEIIQAESFGDAELYCQEQGATWWEIALALEAK